MKTPTAYITDVTLKKGWYVFVSWADPNCGVTVELNSAQACFELLAPGQICDVRIKRKNP